MYNVHHTDPVDRAQKKTKVKNIIHYKSDNLATW